jgi:hypothetical protein
LIPRPQRLAERPDDLRLLVERGTLQRQRCAGLHRLADLRGKVGRDPKLLERVIRPGDGARFHAEVDALLEFGSDTGKAPAYHVLLRAAATRTLPDAVSRMRAFRSNVVCTASNSTSPALLSDSTTSTTIAWSTCQRRAMSANVMAPS